MQVIADLHLHSRFSRAVSKDMNLPVMNEWALKKGIGLLGTGDFTHPIWYREIVSQLKEVYTGIYSLRTTDLSNTSVSSGQSAVCFLLSTELSCIYSQAGKVKRIHLIVFAPNLSVVEKLNKTLTQKNFNLFSDGRPILGISAQNLTRLILEIDENCLVVPAHVWTPWFSLYGSISGFDSIEECFGDMAKYIYAVETGLSSDPAMNWKVEELINRKIVSFGDAHSPAKLGREATVFEIESKGQKSELNYGLIRQAITGLSFKNQSLNSKIAHTIEFYPEEGKYHYSGHRNCGVVYSPNETKKRGMTCPVCGKMLTMGVMSRVESLGKMEIETEIEKSPSEVRLIKNKNFSRPPYVMLVPLIETVAEAIKTTPVSKKAKQIYDLLIDSFRGEFNVLLQTDLSEIEKIVGVKVAEAISKVRSGDIYIEPGYDGVFGKVKIWSEKTEASETKKIIDQKALF